MKRSVVVVALFVVGLLAPSSSAGIARVGVVADGAEFPIVVDVDRNGLDDLILDDHVLLANGGGTFTRRSLGLGVGFDVLDWLDLNGDGNIDLLTRNYDGKPPSVPGLPTYRVHLATGPMQWSTGIQVAEDRASEPYIGDFNGDGKDDLLLQRILFENRRDVAAELTVLISRGDGTFAARTPFLIPTHPQWGNFSRRVLMGDLNGDGLRDAVIRTTSDVAILTATGEGDFTVRTRFLPSPRFGSWATALGDIDRDGHLDIVTSGMRHVHVLFGNGRSGFQRIAMAELPQSRFPAIPSFLPPELVGPTANAPRSLSIGEFTASGRTQILGTTVEGDIFVVGFEKGRLQEVAPRVPTEFIHSDVYVGSFREPGSRDLYVTYNLIYGAGHPKPGLFSTSATPVPESDFASSRGRRRAAGQPAGPATALWQLAAEAQDCAAATTLHALEQDGPWLRNDSASEAMDAVIDGAGLFHFRFFPSWQPHGVQGALSPRAGGGWEGTAIAGTPCGTQHVRFVVN